MRADYKNIVNIYVISVSFVCIAKKKGVSAMKNGGAWRHFDAHGCTEYMQKVFTIISMYIVF